MQPYTFVHMAHLTNHYSSAAAQTATYFNLGNLLVTKQRAIWVGLADRALTVMNSTTKLTSQDHMAFKLKFYF